jgi:hypothetical protein
MTTIRKSVRFWEYWTHGISAIVEFPGQVAEIRHNTLGLDLRQRANTDNWLHLALPSPSMLDNNDVFIIDALLKGKSNENARVDRIRISDHGAILFEQAVNFTDETFDEKFQRPGPGVRPVIKSGITFSVHVSFLTGSPMGAVVIQSAGMRLESD